MVQSKQFRTCQEKEPPIDIPLKFIACTIGLSQYWFQTTRLPGLIEIVEPAIARLFIMCPIDSPMIFDAKVLSKVEQQVITGHGATGEKGIRHPTLVKVIDVVLVGENVHKELALRLEKAIDLLEQVIVILHVFKHFNRHDQVIATHDAQGTLVVGHVALWIRKR